MSSRVIRTVVSSTAVVVAALAGCAPPAPPASPSAVASGSFTSVQTSKTHIRTAGGDSFDLLVFSVTSVGGVTGVATDTFTAATHADGSMDAHGTEVCSSRTIGGRTGSYIAAFSLTVSVAGVLAGHLTFTSGSGGLAGLHGEGTFTAGTYSYNYRFAP
jgi:hypothetical protein